MQENFINPHMKMKRSFHVFNHIIHAYSYFVSDNKMYHNRKPYDVLYNHFYKIVEAYLCSYFFHNLSFSHNVGLDILKCNFYQ